MAIPLYAAIAGSGTIRQIDVRGTADDYDGTVPLAPYLVSNPAQVAGNGGYERLRRVAQSVLAGASGEQLTVTLWRDGQEDAFAVTRDVPAAGPAVVSVSGGATQVQVQLGLTGKQGTEIGSAELWAHRRRQLRSADGT